MIELSNKEIGRRLRVARREKGLTQEEAVKHLRISRPTLVAIEQGKRVAKIDELQILSSLYGMTLNGLLRREAVHVDFVSKFREAGLI